MKTTKNELSTYLGSLIEQLCMISFLWVTLPSDLAWKMWILEKHFKSLIMEDKVSLKVLIKS